MRNYERGKPRGVPKGVTLPFSGHRTLAEVQEDERRNAAAKKREQEDEPA